MATKPPPKKAPPKPVRSKDEVKQSFAALREEVEDLGSAPDPKAEQAARERSADLRAAVEGLDVEGIVQRLSGVGVAVSRALGEVSDKLTREVELLETVREAVALERRELERLHHIDTAATALDQLVQEYARESGRLETEITSRRTEWEQESRTADAQRKEQEEALRKQRQREAEEYEYRKSLERKRQQDKHDEESRERERTNREKQEALERSWQEREEALKDAEQELQHLREETSGFPERLRRETEAATQAARQAAEAGFAHERLALQKDAEAERRFGELQVRTLQDTITRQGEQLALLQKQLDEAKRQVQEIAMRAIEGASEAKALSYVSQIATEQAKARPQG